MAKVPVIELMDYNVLMSLINYFSDNIKDYKVHGKSVNIYQSYSDKHMAYTSPAMSLELLHRKNRSIGFSSFLYDSVDENNFFEFEGVLLEYMVQLNVYSNTRGEIHKWSSILDDILKNGEQGIPINTYNDNGSIKQSSVGMLDFDYDKDVRSNNLIPNVITSDFHTIYEVKITAIQQYKISYSVSEIGDLINTTN
jgi:hypothetical protein